MTNHLENINREKYGISSSVTISKINGGNMQLGAQLAIYRLSAWRPMNFSNGFIGQRRG